MIQSGRTPCERIVTCTEEAWLDALTSGDVRFSDTMNGFQNLDHSWQLRNNVCPENVMYLVTEGAATLRIRRTEVTLSPGTFFYMGHGVRHHGSIADGFDGFTVYWMHFVLSRSSAHGEAADILRLEPDFVHLERANSLLPLFEELHDEWISALPYRITRIRSLMSLIFSSVFRARSAGGNRTAQLRPEQRSEITRFVNANVGRLIKAGDLANALDLSPEYFTRVFRNTYGAPPKQWLVRDRIRRIAAVIATSDRRIGDIAADFGYRNLHLLSRQFRDVTGLSPRQYRRMRHLMP